MRWVYDDGGRRAAGFVGDADDCVTRAIAIAAELPYKTVYARLSEGMRTQRTGRYERKRGRAASARSGVTTRRKWFDDYMRALGWRWVPTMAIGQGCKVHLRNGELPAGRLIVNVSKHFCAVVDGIVYDTHDPTREGNRCVYGYYERAL